MPSNIHVLSFLLLLFLTACFNEQSKYEADYLAIANTYERSVYESKGIYVFNDYDKGIKFNQLVEKKILLYFTCWACMGYHRFEEDFMEDEALLSIIRDQYILITLYVDDRTSLTHQKEKGYDFETVTKWVNLDSVSTTGELFTQYQKERFQTNGQPYYVIMDKEEAILDAFGYISKVEDFREQISRIE